MQFAVTFDLTLSYFEKVIPKREKRKSTGPNLKTKYKVVGLKCQLEYTWYNEVESLCY